LAELEFNLGRNACLLTSANDARVNYANTNPLG